MTDRGGLGVVAWNGLSEGREMGAFSIVHWLIVFAILGTTVWYIAASMRIAEAAKVSPALAFLVLIPLVGGPILQQFLASGLARQKSGQTGG